MNTDILKRLEQFDTPTITNAIATYPKDTACCLGLYDPEEIGWYSNQDLKCVYPHLGPKCGYVVTAVYGTPNTVFNRLEFFDVLEAIEESPKPVILALKHNATDKSKNALLGGNMMTSFKALGIIGVIGDGPTRDVDEMRPMSVQCMFTGTVAGHGLLALQAVNVPIDVCGMSIAPMEIIHMDENGAVKFPAKYAEKILEKATQIRLRDEVRQKAIRKASGAREIADIMKGLYD